MPTTLERSHDGPNPGADAGPTPPARGGVSRRLRTRRRRDSQAKIVVVSGGVLIIAGVLGILFFWSSRSLRCSPEARSRAHAPVAGPATPLGVLTGESRTFVRCSAATASCARRERDHAVRASRRRVPGRRRTPRAPRSRRRDSSARAPA
jgi:hypothetical protein